MRDRASRHVPKCENCETHLHFSLFLVVCCCLRICLFYALHWCNLLTVPKKEKENWKKTKLCWASSAWHLPLPLMLICEVPCSIPCIMFPVRQTLSTCTTSVFLSVKQQTQKYRRSNMHISCLCVSVSPRGWEYNTSHQPGKPLVEAVNNFYLAREFWHQTNSTYKDVLK